MSHYREQLNDFIKNIPALNAGSNVLDIGGSQLPIKDRLKTSERTEYTILDLKQPHKGHLPDIQCDLNEGYFGDLIEKFDYLFCFEVMEYVWNPVKALRTMRYFAKQGAILYISFPFLYPHHNPAGEDCLRYTEWGVKKLLDNSDWKIEFIESRMSKGSLSAFFSSEGMKASKDYIDHDVVGFIVKVRAI